MFISFFAKIIRRHYMIKFGYEISEKTKIGKMFAIVHMGGVVINDKCIIGDNVTLYNGVTLGGGGNGKMAKFMHRLLEIIAG